MVSADLGLFMGLGFGPDGDLGFGLLGVGLGLSWVLPIWVCRGSCRFGFAVGLGSWTVEWVTGVENEEEKRNEEREKKVKIK